MMAEQELWEIKTMMEERNMLVEELDSIIMVMRDDFKNTEKLCLDQ
jgi:hypothetical protein